MRFMRMWNLWVCCALVMLSAAVRATEFAYVVGKTTYLPLTELARWLGSDAQYDAAKKQFILGLLGKGEFVVTPDSKTVTHDGKPLKLEAKTFLLDGDLYVPMGALTSACDITFEPIGTTGYLRTKMPDGVAAYQGALTLVSLKMTPETLTLRQRPIPDASARAIFNAMAQNKTAELKALLKKNPELRFAQDNGGNLPLHVAAHRGLGDMVTVLLANGASPNDRTTGDNGETPLHLCMNPDFMQQDGRHDIGKLDDVANDALAMPVAEMAALLIKARADVNAPTACGETPLHYAGANDAIDPSIITILLNAGAKVDAKDVFDQTPLFALANAKAPDAIFYLLLAKGADVKHTNIAGATLLHAVALAITEETAMIKPLLAHGLSLDAKDKEGDTPFFLAAITGHEKIMAYLLEQGADINAADNTQSTALMWIAGVLGEDGDALLKRVNFLLAHGAHVNAAKDGENSPLHCACQAGNAGIVKALLAAGARVNALDQNGNTPLKIATAGNHAEVIKLLQAAGGK